MRWSVALAIGLGSLASREAAADDARDLFGLGKKPKTEEPAPTCDEPHTFGCAQVTDPLDDASPYTLSTWLTGEYLLSLPVGYATHDQVAQYGLGASRDETGVVLGGATGLENRWTLDGAPIDNLRTGAVDTRIPLTFLDGMSVRAGGFTARDRTSTGGVIDAQLVKGGSKHVLDARVWAGLAADSPDRPIASGSYSLRRLTLDAPLQVAASLVGKGPIAKLAGGTAWYAVGIAPEANAVDARWQTARLVDLDGDGVPDGLPGPLATETLASPEQRTYDWFVPAMLRAGYDRGAHHLDLTLIGQGSFVTRYLANATVQAAGIDRDDIVVDGIATWRGEWRSTRARIQLAWHHSEHDESAHDAAAAGIPQLLSAYVPTTLADDPALAAACNDGTYPGIPQCPVPYGYFASGGAGVLVDSVGDRPTVTADVAHRIGNNVLRAGGTFEDTRLVQTSRLTGGEQLRSLFDGHLDHMRYVMGHCDQEVGGACDYADESKLRYRTRYTAAYLEDTFSPREDIRVDGGVRWELMWVGERLHFSDELSPRLGVSWDPLGGGRSRVWASMGRAFAMLPAGLGPTLIHRDATVHDVETGVGPGRDTDAGAAYRIAADIEPEAQDEATLGVELGLTAKVRLVAWLQGRWLRRGLETTPIGFDNPGHDGGEPARRSTEQLAVELATSPTAKLALRIGYLAGRTVGNFPGPWDPREGATLYNADAFDTGFVSPNDYGRLPTDVGHRLYVETSRRGRVRSVGIQVALRLSLSSGRPRNAVALTDVGPVQLVQRGSLGRGEMIASTNARVAATWRGFELGLDVLNVFDRDTATTVDEVYVDSLVRPIEGGTYSDLVFLKSSDGSLPGRRTGFGLPTSFQSPVSAVLALRKGF